MQAHHNRRIQIEQINFHGPLTHNKWKYAQKAGGLMMTMAGWKQIDGFFLLSNHPKSTLVTLVIFAVIKTQRCLTLPGWIRA